MAQGTYTAVNLPVDGETIDASDVNVDLQGLINEFNESLDNNKIVASAGIELSKLEASTAGKTVYTADGTTLGFYILDGWIPFPTGAVYVDANTVSLSGDWTTVFATGDKIKFVQNSVTKYWYICASPVFSAGSTTFDVVSDIGVVVENAAITLPFYSKATSPVGFPHWFSFTPTVSGTESMTVAPVTDFKCVYKMDGNSLTLAYDFLPQIGGTLSYGIYATIPTGFTVVARTWVGAAFGENTGGFNSAWDSSVNKVIWRKYNGGNLTAGGTYFRAQITVRV